MSWIQSSRESFTIYLSKSYIFQTKSVDTLLLLSKVGHHTHLTHLKIFENTLERHHMQIQHQLERKGKNYILYLKYLS